MLSSERTPQRVRHDLKRRIAEVRVAERFTPHMARIVLGGDELEGFVSAGFDDHMKLIFPAPGETRPVLPETGPDGLVFPDGKRPPMRDYTPRRWNPDARTLEVHFALHEGGPATEWAKRARPGDLLGIGGPRGSLVIPREFAFHVLIGDETALPAIGRRLEELPAGVRAIVVVEVDGAGDEQDFATAAALDVSWVHRQGAAAGDPARLLAAVRAKTIPIGDTYAWVACESGVAKRLRGALIDEKNLDKAQIRASGYWRRGASAVHEMQND